jgi:hypothetical protein
MQPKSSKIAVKSSTPPFMQIVVYISNGSVGRGHAPADQLPHLGCWIDVKSYDNIVGAVIDRPPTITQ